MNCREADVAVNNGCHNVAVDGVMACLGQERRETRRELGVDEELHAPRGITR